MRTVYVIQLSRSGYKYATHRLTSPTGLAYVYVGQTWHTPEERLATHCIGGSGTSSTVRKFGLGLRPELYLGLPLAHSEQEALTLERDWAIFLADTGFTTLSDGCLRRPGAHVQPVSDLDGGVEDYFDGLLFQACAKRGAVDCDGMFNASRKINVPDGSWRTRGRFAHVDPRTIRARIRFLDERGYLAVAATGERTVCKPHGGSA